jgi:hypothetical protein
MIDLVVEDVVTKVIDPDGQLRAEPEVVPAVCAMVRSLLQTNRLTGATLLHRLADRFGDTHFPVMIKLLCIVGASPDDRAKRLVCNALAQCMRLESMPSGALSSWGLPAVWAPGEQIPPTRFAGALPARKLNPVAYLIAWYSQPTNRTSLEETIYVKLLSELLALFSNSPMSRQLYCNLLEQNVQFQRPGTFHEVTGKRILFVAQQWMSGLAPQEIALGSTQMFAPTLADYFPSSLPR